MHGDDEPYGSVQRVELFDKFPRRVKLTDDVEHHEPRRHRGRALAGVAGGEQGAAHRAGAERARPAGGRPARRLGRAATRRGSTPTTTGTTTSRRRRSWTPLWRPIAERRDAAGVRRPARRPRRRARPGRAGRASPTSTRTCARCSATACRAFNLRYCGKGSLDACRASLWAALHQRCATTWPRSSASPDPATWLATARAHRVHAGPDPEHDARPPTARRSSRCSSSSRAVGLAALVRSGRRGRARTTRGCRRRRWPRAPAVGQVLDQQQAVAPVGVLDALCRR